MLTRQWQQLNDVRCLLSKQIDPSEVEMASFLVKTPYILLLTVGVLTSSRQLDWLRGRSH